MSTKKYLDENGLSYFWSKIDDAKVDKVTGKQLSTEDYTTAEKTKLSSIATGAEVNVIENISVNGVTGTISGKTASVTVPTGAGTIDSISVNGTAQTIDQNKNVDIAVPTKVSDLPNDSGYQTASDVSSAISGKLDTSAVKTSQTTSDSDTYSCTYVNGEFNWIETWCNLLDSEVQSKLNKTAVKTSKTTSGTDTYSCTYINDTINASTPVGVISAYGGSSAPSGYLLCDGSAVSRTTYADLYSVIGTTYGQGNGSTTFNVPNLKGRIPVGYNSSETEFNYRGKTGGSKALQQHKHEGLYWGTGSEFAYTGNTDSPTTAMFDLAGGGVHSANYNVTKTNHLTTANSGSGNAGNLQPYLVVNYIIKATKN